MFPEMCACGAKLVFTGSRAYEQTAEGGLARAGR